MYLHSASWEQRGSRFLAPASVLDEVRARLKTLALSLTCGAVAIAIFKAFLFRLSKESTRATAVVGDESEASVIQGRSDCRAAIKARSPALHDDGGAVDNHEGNNRSEYPIVLDNNDRYHVGQFVARHEDDEHQ